MFCGVKVFIHRMYKIDIISNKHLIHRWWANLSVKINISFSLPEYDKTAINLYYENVNYVSELGF